MMFISLSETTNYNYLLAAKEDGARSSKADSLQQRQIIAAKKYDKARKQTFKSINQQIFLQLGLNSTRSILNDWKFTKFFLLLRNLGDEPAK